MIKVLDKLTMLYIAMVWIWVVRRQIIEASIEHEKYSYYVKNPNIVYTLEYSPIHCSTQLQQMIISN
jgi:hypothetical protein